MRTDWRAEELVPGARVTWRQFTNTSEPEQRTGTVWDRAPTVDGVRAAAWIVPDSLKPYDLYGLIAVGIASRDHSANGFRSDRPDDYASKGELFSSSVGSSPLGNLGAFAAQQAWRARKAKGRAA